MLSVQRGRLSALSDVLRRLGQHSAGRTAAKLVVRAQACCQRSEACWCISLAGWASGRLRCSCFLAEQGRRGRDLLHAQPVGPVRVLHHPRAHDDAVPAVLVDVAPRVAAHEARQAQLQGLQPRGGGLQVPRQGEGRVAAAGAAGDVEGLQVRAQPRGQSQTPLGHAREGEVGDVRPGEGPERPGRQA